MELLGMAEDHSPEDRSAFTYASSICLAPLTLKTSEGLSCGAMSGLSLVGKTSIDMAILGPPGSVSPHLATRLADSPCLTWPGAPHSRRDACGIANSSQTPAA